MGLPPFSPVFPVPVIALVTGVAMLCALAGAWRGRPMRPAWLKVLALLFRLAALGMLALLLLNPSLQLPVPVSGSSSVVLIDKSASMSLGAPGGPTRWQEAAQWVDELVQGAKAAGLSAPVMIPFDSTARPPVADLTGVHPDGRETNLSGALGQVLAGSGSSPPDDLIIVSDGDGRDRAALPGALALAAAQHVSISTRLVGRDTPPRNAWIVSVQAPRIVRPKALVSVHVALAATGFTPQKTLPLILKDENGKVVAQSDFQLPGDSAGGEGAPVERTLVFDAGLRTTRYTLELGPGDGEVAVDDNRFSFTIETANTKLRVLFVEGTHVKRTVGDNGYALNDMEFMTRAWEATGEIEAVCLTPVSEYLNRPNIVGVSFANGEMVPDPSRSFPSRREDLYDFDVIIISDVPKGNFSENQMQWVVDWVTQRGGGFLMAGGFTSFDSGRYDKTLWEKITPVNMVDYGAGYDISTFEIAIPDAVKNHPIWRLSPDPAENARILATHPPFRGMNRIRRAKPGATVLSTRPDSDNEPVFAAQSYGRGRSIAFLSDPNGGWGTEFLAWGPPGGPSIGPQTELGHGGDFKVDQSAVHAGQGTPPPYPSPYYGQFWVNVVNWLAENSVRWRRDKLAGRVVAAQAQPGKDLPVAAEVLSVTKPDEQLALDVGARLDLPGSPRVRLEYDRDRREFTGHVPVPTEIGGTDVGVIFDVVAAGESLTDSVRVGLRRVNLEYVDTAPDPVFLAELAHAAGGRTLGTSADAVELLRGSDAAHARQQLQTWRQPLWAQWPWWTAIMVLLGAEWILRRVGGRPVVVVLAALFLGLLPPATQAADPGAAVGTGEIPALVAQLGARYVRQRDEAEEKLKSMFPEAAEAVNIAAKNSPNEEVRLRATGILRALRQNRWQLEKTLVGHRLGTDNQIRGLAAAPGGSHFYTRGKDFLRQWNSSTLAAEKTFGPALTDWTDWQVYGPVFTVALSPDGSLVMVTGDHGEIYLYHTSDGRLAMRLVSDSSAELWAAAFFPDGQRLATAARDGQLTVWDLQTQKPVLTSQSPSGRQDLPSLGISPNGRFVVLSLDLPGRADVVWVWDMEKRVWCASQRLSHRITSIVFNHDGTQFIGGTGANTLLLWRLGPDGSLSEARQIGHFQAEVFDAIFSSDEKSILAVSGESGGQLSEWQIESGEEIWRSLPLDGELRQVALLDDHRLAATGSDAKIRVWHRNAVP